MREIFWCVYIRYMQFLSAIDPYEIFVSMVTVTRSNIINDCARDALIQLSYAMLLNIVGSMIIVATSWVNFDCDFFTSLFGLTMMNSMRDVVMRQSFWGREVFHGWRETFGVVWRTLQILKNKFELKIKNKSKFWRKAMKLCSIFRIVSMKIHACVQ